MCRNLITCYGVTVQDEKIKFLTITSSKEEALEYVENLIRLSYIKDYKAWAYFNKIENLSDKNNWYTYARNRLSKEDFTQYNIVKCKFNATGVSLALRIINNCIPIGSSFDEKAEYMSLIEASKYDTNIKQIVKELQESICVNDNASLKLLENLKENDQQPR